MKEPNGEDEKKDVSLFYFAEIEVAPWRPRILHAFSTCVLNALAVYNFSGICCRLEQANRIKAEKAKASFDAKKAKNGGQERKEERR